MEDGVGGVDEGAGDGKIGGPVRHEAEDKSHDDTEDEKSQKNRREQVASGGLGELELRHWHENSKGDASSGRLKRTKGK